MENTGKTALGLDGNVGSLICYLNICVPAGFIYSIIVLVTDKTNKLPRFHAVQSLLLSAVTAVVCIAVWILLAIAVVITRTPELGFLGMLIWLIALVSLGVGILAGVKGYGGQAFKLPIIGDMADKWSN